MNKMLLIDTSSNKEIRIGLRIDAKEHIVTQKIGYQKAQVILPLIDRILYKQKLKITDVNSIKIDVRRGSFTGQRIGMSIANALSFALKIPVLRSFDSQASSEAQDDCRTCPAII